MRRRGYGRGVHIVMFLDQHPESLGGAQLSARLQRRFLERNGHRVTICSPASFRHGGTTGDPGYWLTRSFPATIDREYSFTLPSKRVDAAIDALAATAPPVDIVHVQGDYWQAALGLRFAKRHGIPVVLTLHNRIDVGIQTAFPLPWLSLRVLALLQRIWLGKPAPDDARPLGHAWRFLRRLAASSNAVIAPSHHFADLLRSEGVSQNVDVIPTGVDDDLLHLAEAHGDHESDRPVFVWAGRMSQEKRLMQFLEAIALSRPLVRVEIYGAGHLKAAAHRFVARANLSDSVFFMGQIPYDQMLTAIARADALVQTSRGFETQGMTVSESLALGTPVVLCDPAIAAELPADSFWLTTDGSVESLASVLTDAVSDVVAGTAPAPTIADATQLLESALVLDLERVYERVLSAAPTV
jgi:1,2-diacylglycerol 3-alpha-glucosyltransferase